MFDTTNNSVVAMTYINNYFCPTRRAPGVYGSSAKNDYAGNGGSEKLANKLATTNDGTMVRQYALPKAGLPADMRPDNRRRLAMRLTEHGRNVLQQPSESGALASALERLAPSEVRAIERAVEILERAV